MIAVISADKLYSFRYASERNIGETATRTISGLNFPAGVLTSSGPLNILIEILRMFSIGTLNNFKLVQEQEVIQQ